ncbi:MAG: hypothetical protein Q8K97_09360 [Pseudohongiella sp.]|nr:hypothetical protein [Pseudohongiella sp.]
MMEGNIVIEAADTPDPVFILPFTEAELLHGMTPYTAHLNELAQLTDREIGKYGAISL